MAGLIECGTNCAQPPSGTRLRLLREVQERAEQTECQALMDDMGDGFVCGVCARRLLPRCITRGHYPAESAGGSDLVGICLRCNNAMGAYWEKRVRHLLEQAHGVADARVLNEGSLSGPSVRTRFGFDDGPRVEITDLGKGPSARRAGQLLDRDGSVLRVQLLGDHEFHRAILSWSFLHWFALAGYQFALSEGARFVARLLLDPADNREAVWVQYASRPIPATLPTQFGRPEPSLALAVPGIGGSPQIIGIASTWEGISCILPMGGDGDASAYEQLKAWQAPDHFTMTMPIVFRPFSGLFPESIANRFLGAATTGAHLVVGAGYKQMEAALAAPLWSPRGKH